MNRLGKLEVGTLLFAMLLLGTTLLASRGGGSGAFGEPTSADNATTEQPRQSYFPGDSTLPGSESEPKPGAPVFVHGPVR